MGWDRGWVMAFPLVSDGKLGHHFLTFECLQ